MSGAESALSTSSLAGLNWARLALMLVWILALPVFLIATNVRWVTLDLTTYTSGFARQRISERTGITSAELERIGRELIEFFKGNRLTVQIEAHTPEGFGPLFNQREVDHMADVRAIMHAVFRAQAWAGGALALSLALVLWLWRHDPISGARPLIIAGVASTLALGAIMAVLSLLDFRAVFLQFHLLSFSNDLWLLDPERDYLIRLFPERFWYETTLRLAWMTAAEVAALGGLAWALPLFKGR